MKRAYVTVDVFTDRKFGGNPLAVVLDAEGLATAQMQAIAAEFNYAETTFVLPPRNAEHTAQVRIFTPKAELPFAGHPNIGTAFVLAHLGKVTGERIVFEEKAGLVRLDVARERGTVAATTLQAPQELSLGAEIAPDVAAACCALSADQIETANHRPLIASCGAALAFVELKSRAALAAAHCQAEQIARHLPAERALGIHLYVQAKEESRDIQCRMFAPLLGVPEDPATGAANVALIGLLAHIDQRHDLRMEKTIGQGFDMGRPSVLEASAEKKAGKVVATYIGGRSVPVMQGEIELD